MTFDINNLNHHQLKDLIGKAQQRQVELRKEGIVEVRKKVHDLIKAEGYSFEELFGSARGKTRTSNTVPPKYYNPENHNQTWSGRGKQPLWFEHALRMGKQKQDMEI